MAATSSKPLNIGKSYLVSQTDMNALPPPPKGKRALVVNSILDVDSIAAMIATGIATIFTQGCVLDYTYEDKSGGIHGHIFTQVKDTRLISLMESKVIVLVRYQLQTKKSDSNFENPHNIGKSSRSSIWVNQPKTTRTLISELTLWG